MIEEERVSMLDSVFMTPLTPAVGDISIFDHQHVPTGWVQVTGQTLQKSEYPQIYERYFARDGWYLQYDYFNLQNLETPEQETGYYIYLGT